MDEMTTFDQQIAREVLREAGPSEPVAVAAIFNAITAAQSPKWRFQSMFSATKFVVAGVIVALFGGFLMAGVLTQPRGDELAPAAATGSPSLITTEELLSGMVTEEVEPGVLRIRDDGAGYRGIGVNGVTVSPDGRVFLFNRGSMFELGRAESEVKERAIEPGFFSDMAFTPDGILWAKQDAGQDEGTLASFDGQGWTEHPLPDGSPIVAIEAMPDGAVLVTEYVEDGPGPLVARLDDGGWTTLPTLDDPDLAGSYHGGYLAAAPDGTVWLSNAFIHDNPTNPSSPQGLLHYDGVRWQSVGPIPDAPDAVPGPLAVGPDGTLWVYMFGEWGQDRYLARWADDTWSVFSEDDGVPTLVWPQDWESRFEVDGDGTLWMPYRGDSDGPIDVSADRCPGVISFDGDTWRQYLEGHCVTPGSSPKNDLAVAPDGSVWVTSGLLLYVITPEAVAVAE